MYAQRRVSRDNRRTEADDHLTKALVFFQSVGATRYLRAAE